MVTVEQNKVRSDNTVIHHIGLYTLHAYCRPVLTN